MQKFQETLIALGAQPQLQEVAPDAPVQAAPRLATPQEDVVAIPETIVEWDSAVLSQAVVDAQQALHDAGCVDSARALNRAVGAANSRMHPLKKTSIVAVCVEQALANLEKLRPWLSRTKRRAAAMRAAEDEKLLAVTLETRAFKLEETLSKAGKLPYELRKEAQTALATALEQAAAARRKAREAEALVAQVERTIEREDKKRRSNGELVLLRLNNIVGQLAEVAEASFQRQHAPTGSKHKVDPETRALRTAIETGQFVPEGESFSQVLAQADAEAAAKLAEEQRLAAAALAEQLADIRQFLA